MDLLSPNSWFIVIAAGGTACILAANGLNVAATLWGLSSRRRHFRRLIAVRGRDSHEYSDKEQEAQTHALSLRYEFVSVFRSYRRTQPRIRMELWRAADRKTLALVSIESGAWRSRRYTAFVSVLDTGARITTCDHFDEGDPLALKGEMIHREAAFRDLHALHHRRIERSGRACDTIGQTNPLSVIEDLERARVLELAAGGLARYRDEAQISWSYTPRGAFHVYFRARPRQIRQCHMLRVARAELAE